MTFTGALALSSALLSSSLIGGPAEAVSPEQPLADSTWVAPAPLLSSSSQSLGLPDRTPSLTLSGDGTASGHDSCNWFGGSWEQDGASIRFPGYWNATARACAFDDPWLLEADSAEVDGATMLVFDEAGNQLGTLVRR